MSAARERAAASVARLLSVGFHGTRVPQDLSGLIARGVQSVVLFSRNVGEPEDVFSLVQELKRVRVEPLLVAVDQEGGAVQRLRRGFTELPPFRALGNSGDAALAHALGSLIGRELRSVGVDWNFAPVLDVATNPANPVIGARALSSNPDVVAELGCAFAAGLVTSGVAACGKHFPGHGDTELDSHLALPKLSHALDRLERVELLPFMRAIQRGIPSLMSAHVVFSALEPALPATLSERVIRGLLRERLGYQGLVVSDDLEMKAIADHYGVDDAAIRGLSAGVDMFLVCHSAERAHSVIDALSRAVRAGDIALEHVESALERQRAFASRWAAPALERADFSALRSEANRALTDRLRRFVDAAPSTDPTDALPVETEREADGV